MFQRSIGLMLGFALLFLAGCNYNYHRALELEKEGRYEEAYIEFHRAYSEDPDDDDFKEGYERNVKKTVEDLLDRYQRYLNRGHFRMAYARLEHASNLEPNNPRVIQELKQWTKVLVAGKLELDFQSMKSQIPMAEDMLLVVVLNTPDPSYNLIANVDYKSSTFSAVDQVYHADIRHLLSYSVNSIGLRLERIAGMGVEYQKLVDFKRVQVGRISGSLRPTSSGGLTDVAAFYPMDLLKQKNALGPWVPEPGMGFEAKMDGDRIQILNTEKVDFLPQMLYLNQQDRQYLLDYGILHLDQKSLGGAWFYQRRLDPKREYLNDVKKKVLLSPLFEFREGAYPLVK